ncbi:MAG: outer membrane beta-barrel protein [Betaproteobacteria bacterium AqS2]|uniref:Outer membrane beta-barrel protein n=1 Tax=Candidatus Amphirhobacter heronislandensis TaxID=1732024 RepID=A0A930Y3F4_9GAMM|nr:outer membrane beta-barrel protein [Betaproteobacteria bacterium AqS2]
MSKARRILASIAAAAALAAAASAEQTRYVGFDIGAGRSNDTGSYCAGLGINDCEKDGLLLRFRGGFEFSEHVAGEFFYAETNDMAVEQVNHDNNIGLLTGEYHMQFTGAAVKLILPAETVNAFVRLGFHNWKREGSAATASSPNLSRVDFSGSGTNFAYGFGAEYKLAPNMRVLAAYDNYKTADLDVAGAGIGLSFHF